MFHPEDPESELVPQQSSSFSPFREMAMCISGGGFRAASYGLGTMSYLNHVKIRNEETGEEKPLLNRISYISSASGGTIAAAALVCYLYEGRSFLEMYKDLKTFMRGHDFMDKVMEILKSDKVWNKTPKHRNMVNALSLAYNEMLFKNRKFEILWEQPKNAVFLKKVCFNAVEFNNGITFRFKTDNDENTRDYFGNKYIRFKRDGLEVLKKLRIADAVASSSCFPAGLEPILFPDDFAYDDKEGKLKKEEIENALAFGHNISSEREKYLGKPIGIMDGGINDNQALQSMILEFNNRVRNESSYGRPFDTVLVADVSSFFLNPYAQPIGTKKGILSWLSLNKIGWISTLVFILSMLGILYGSGLLFIISSLILVPSFALSSLFVYLLYQVSKLGKKQGSWSKTILRYHYFFFKLPLSDLLHMLKARALSVVMLAADLYLKQIRRLSYDYFYEHPSFKNRRASSIIYTLSETNATSSENRLKYQLKLDKETVAFLAPSDAMKKTAEEARRMETTFWYDNNDSKMLDTLIATAQFTTCHTLLVYCYELQKEGVSFDPELQNIFQNLRKDWEAFKRNDRWLVEEINEKIRATT